MDSDSYSLSRSSCCHAKPRLHLVPSRTPCCTFRSLCRPDRLPLPTPHRLEGLEAADRIPFCPPRITESGHYATTASPTPRQIYFLSSLPAKPSQLSALPRRSDSILPLFKRFPRKQRPIFSLQLRFLTVLLLPDPAPPFQSWFSHSFPSASADMYLWSCYDADQIMEPLSGNSPSAPP